MSAKIRKCLSGKLATKVGYGKASLAKAMKQYDIYEARYRADGMTPLDASAEASAQVLRDVDASRLDKVKKTVYNANRVLGIRDQVQAARNVPSVAGQSTLAKKIGTALMSILEYDPRMPGHASWQAEQEYAFNRYRYYVAEDAAKNFSKGAWGRTKGRGNHADIVSEIHNPGSTTNQVAQRIAEGWRKFRRAYISEMNLTGVTLKPGGYEALPIAPNSARLVKVGEAQFITDMEGWIDWNKTLMPSGAIIAPADRADFLKKLYHAYRTDDFDAFEAPFLETGGMFAEALRSDNMVRLKGATDWQDFQAKYGDGDVLDVVIRSMEMAANNFASAKIFGTNARSAIRVAIEEANQLAKTGNFGGKQAEAINQIGTEIERFKNTADIMLRLNPMDAENKWGVAVGGLKNIITAALLGRAFLAALFGDLRTTWSTQLAQGYGRGFAKTVGMHLTNLPRTGTVMNELADAGWTMKELVALNFKSARFAHMAEYGTHYSRNWANWALRATGLNRHTNTLIAVNQLDRLRRMARYAEEGRSLADIPDNIAYRFAGITEAEWTKIKTGMTTRNRNGKLVFMPLADEAKNGMELTAKIFRMLGEQSRLEVIQPGAQAQARMHGGQRPTSLTSAIKYEMMSYLGFTYQSWVNGTRMFGGLPGARSRSKYVASAAFGGLVAGVFIVQVRNLTSGKEPYQYDDPELYYRALVAGLPLGILGDLASGSMYGSTEMPLGGPVIDFAASTIMPAGRLAAALIADADYDETAEFRELTSGVTKYLIPQNWYTGLVLQRDFFEVLDEAIDPGRARRRQSSQRRRERENDTPYFAPPGQAITPLGEIFR